MKRELAALAAITIAVSLLASCGIDTAEVSLPPVEPTPLESSEPSGSSMDLYVPNNYFRALT